LYDRLFNDEAPDAGGKNFLDSINPESLVILSGCKAEIGLQNAGSNDRYQFEREGYFILDEKYTTPEKPVFNQIIGLKDTWEKIKNT
ncbi:MAG TPA: glutamine--tRNA ligase, partial [Thiomicrospira sp.]|nr:glutamine--tRNA ligase [Thiomicrospira sp.]